MTVKSPASKHASTPACNKIITSDCRNALAKYPDNTFSACITDPPYNYEFIGRDWDNSEIERRVNRVQNSSTLVKNIPYGSGLAGGVRNKRWYQRNRENIVEYQEWCSEWSTELFRTLRPGAYALVFNSTRTIAHVQVALEAAGFYARDVLVYRRHAGIPKGLNFSKKLEKLGHQDASAWDGWHSCLRNEWEAICLVQKPLNDNYLKTIDQWGVGLMHARPTEGNGFQANILEDFARTKEDPTDAHCTVKPLSLMRFLVQLVVPTTEKHIVLDPFAGTGTTCVAAKELGHSFVGIEINSEHSEYARKRLRNVTAGSKPYEYSCNKNTSSQKEPRLFD